VQASLALAQAIAEQGERRFVGAGTRAEYDWSQARLSEQATRLAPRNLCGASNLDFFRILDAYARQSGLSAALGRVFYLFGPHEDPQRLVSSICVSLLRGGEALAEGLLSALSDESALRDSARQLEALVRQRFLWRIQAERYKEIYAQLLAS
jgi:nucleoside-diphosphate-sugar epimerase